MNSTKSKFINIRYLFVKEIVLKKYSLIEYIGAYLMLNYPLTIDLTSNAFHGHLANLSLIFDIALD